MNGKFISQTLTLELSNSNYFYLIYQINSPDCYFIFRPPPPRFPPKLIMVCTFLFVNNY